MVMKRLVFILISFFAIFACTREDELFDKNAECGTMRFTASIETDATKVSLSGTSSDAVRSMNWNPGDRIFVTGGITSAAFENVELTDTPTAIFEGPIVTGDKYYAFYPYSDEVRYKSGNISFYLPGVQKYVRDGVAPDALPMVATCLEDGSFRFRNLLGIFVLNLVGNGEEVYHISFSGADSSGNGVPLAGNADVSTSFTTNPVVSFSGNALSSLTLDCTDSEGHGVVLGSDPVTFHLAVPAGEYSSFSLRIRTSDGSMVVKSSKALYIKRSERTTTENLTFQRSAGNDLSAEGTANCYIVPSFGEYFFDATVKGNSNESVGAAVSASVVWESFNTLDMPNEGDVVSNVKYDGGDVSFVANRNGNALIAVKDASNNILWSWHIWVCEGYDANASAQLYYNGAGLFMDRNLGALSAAPGDVRSLGLQYYWGRKDPFLSYGSLTEYNTAASTGSFEWVNCTQETGTIAYAVRHPNHIIYNGDSSRDWLYSEQPDTTRWGVKKTIYDPCPNGWRVPDNQAFSNANRGHSQNVPVFDKVNKAANMSGCLGDSPQIWYQSIEEENFWAYIWSNYYGRERYDSNFYFKFNYVYINPNGEFYFTHSISSYNSSFYIRCCSEKTSPTVVPGDVDAAENALVKIGGKIVSDNGYPVTAEGVVISTSDWRMRDLDFSVPDEIQEFAAEQVSDNFTVSVSGLKPAVTYYYRVYAENYIGRAYSDMKSFTAPGEGSSEGVGNNTFEW